MGGRSRVGLALSVLAVAGCGASATPRKASHAAAPPSSLCKPAAAAALARFLHVPAAGIRQADSTGSNAMPECGFAARTATGQRLTVTANVDSSPQPYFRLERTAVEAGQALVGQAASIPQTIYHVGIDAYWFPARTQLQSTDGFRLVTVTIDWTASQRRQLALAEAVARSYLKPNKNPADPALFKGQPAPP